MAEPVVDVSIDDTSSNESESPRWMEADGQRVSREYGASRKIDA
jgi:hypothetical protein